MLYRPALSGPQASAPTAPVAPRPPRIPALDAARALGVVAMVMGHTLDAVLAPAVRETPLAIAYWKARGLTAPLFLLVSGWAVTVAISRGRARGAAVVRGRVPRVLLLLAIGYALRWPGWATDALLAGDRAAWSHLLAFDALHTIALALLATVAVLSLPWSTRERALALAGLLVLAWALGLRAPAPLAPSPSDLPGAPAVLALWQAAGGSSPFPLFPWAAYFFAGGLLALASREGRPRPAAMAAVGAALVAATCWTGVGTMPPADPRLLAFRIGVVLLVLAGLCAVPAAVAGRLAPLGRASLGLYALHVPVVYGWSTHAGLAQRVGPTQGFGAGALWGLAVLAASLAALLAGRAALGQVRAAAGRLRAALAGRGAVELD